MNLVRCTDCGRQFAVRETLSTFYLCPLCRARWLGKVRAVSAPGVRFYEKVVAEYEFAQSHPGLMSEISRELRPELGGPQKHYANLLHYLKSLDTKRMIFDAHQAAVFSESGQLPELAQNQRLVEWEAVQKWDGKLPQITGGAVPFINVPAGQR